MFTQLLARDPSGEEWLPRLLALPERSDGTRRAFTSTGKVERWGWSPKEVRLAPPAALLEHLVQTPPASLAKQLGQRALLAARDEATVEEALRLLRARDRKSAEKVWYVLEGDTHVDAYLETSDMIVVIEGKRTEAGPTTHTTWMPVRHQMLRNIDAVWDGRGAKTVVGFFIVEADANGDTPPAWRRFVADTISEEALAGSLPHRQEHERLAIANAFLGVTTWREVCRAFDLSFEQLPDEVD